MSGGAGTRLRIFFDGGCRPNPGMMEVAAVARGVAYVRRDIGEGDSQTAEWRALLHALEIAAELGGTDVELIGDSLPVLRIASGAAKARPADHACLEAFQANAKSFARIRLRQVKRSQNLAGIALNKAHPR